MRKETSNLQCRSSSWKLETGEVDWIVDHPDYVKADLDLASTTTPVS